MNDKTEGSISVAAPVFIIDCPVCKAKVGAEEKGRMQRGGWIDEAGEPWGDLLLMGSCPKCKTYLVGTARQTHFHGFEDEEDVWTDIVRVYPSPPKTFSSYRIPHVVTASLSEADKAIQADAHMAACVMFGRALEAVCRNILIPKDDDDGTTDDKKKNLMLGAGIKQMREKNIIDDRLFDWSQHLQVFRNLSAHPDENFSVSRVDAEDLQAFVYAIIEYVYDLTDRYEEFKQRLARQATRFSWKGRRLTE
jgi:Domain of unknown function (DUF4145)